MTDPWIPDAELVTSVIDEYSRELDRFQKLTSIVDRICRDAVDAGRVRALVTSRTKQAASLERKLRSRGINLHGGNPPITATSIIGRLNDLSAARVAVYREADRGRATDAIVRTWGVNDRRPTVDVKDKASGYSAVHIDATLPADLSTPDLRNVSATRFEIQVVGMFSHLWSEVEHDIRYKTGDLASVSDEEELHLDSLRRQTEAADLAVHRALAVRARRVAQHVADLLPSDVDVGRPAVEAASIALSICGIDESESQIALIRAASRRDALALNRAEAGGFSTDTDLSAAGCRMVASLVEDHYAQLREFVDDEARIAEKHPDAGVSGCPLVVHSLLEAFSVG